MRDLKIVFSMILLMVFAIGVQADDLRDSLFGKVDKALAQANEVDGSVLTPVSYGEARKLYLRATEAYEKGRKIDRIKADLLEATEYFNKSVKGVELAAVTFPAAIEARKDALAAKADEYAVELWADASQSFAVAAKRLEGGNVKTARKKSAEAEELFRNAELAAIKANYLTETRALIKQAKRDKVDRYAPKTLAQAEKLLASAERALSENRYDIDQPRSIAREAKYEANHAVQIAKLVIPVEKGKVETEDLVLALEAPIVEIASSLDLVAELDGQSANPIKSIMDRIATLKSESYELGEAKASLSQLETEISYLEERMGMQNERIDRQEKRRARLAKVDALFTDQEAIVLTKGNDVLVRMVGVSFSPGKSTIDPKYFGLLAKVQKALDIFPGSPVTIEGHTDSFGGDNVNLQLSRKRADAVRAYLLANMKRTNMSILAEGFGETKPIGNNETAEGRSNNRRIDLVIKTQ